MIDGKPGGVPCVKKRPAEKRPVRKWSARVTRTSHALALEEGVFSLHDPRRIARSLLRSAEASRDRKAPPFRSAMSVLAFYMNRAGKKLDTRQRRVLERAKDELRGLKSEHHAG